MKTLLLSLFAIAALKIIPVEKVPVRYVALGDSYTIKPANIKLIPCRSTG